MQSKEILIWLGIFIVGSLVVTWILSPGSFSSFKDNLSPGPKPITQTDIENLNLTEVPTALPCSVLELGAQSNGISEKEAKEKQCTYICGSGSFNPSNQEVFTGGLEYYSFECKIDKLYCYCKH